MVYCIIIKENRISCNTKNSYIYWRTKMKTEINLLIILTIFIILITGGCGSNPSASATVDELDVAIRDASDYLNENIPKGNKIVILNIQSNSSDLSDYIIDELLANAVNDKVFTVVDRQQLEAIRAEQNFQMSGEVDDKEALAIGKFLGAQTIVSGAVNSLGTGYRIRIRALEVQTAQVQGQYNRNITSSPMITALIASRKTTTTVPPVPTLPDTSAPSASTSPTAPTVQGAPAAPAISANTVPVVPPIEGTMVPGGSLTEKLAWLQRSADSHNTYIIEVTTNENINRYTFEFSGRINITIVLKGVGVNRNIRLRSNDIMFWVASNVTLILDNNITLQGHSQNNSVLVFVAGGIFKMNNGSVITGNNGGGVYVNSGTFEMNGGTITGNITREYGGGVNIGYRSTFIMTDGTISGNTANRGGGVCNAGTFTMRGGTITGNIAHEYGGGVYVTYPLYVNDTFAKSNGTITGYSSDQSNGNVVRDTDDFILARRGHAVWVSENLHKETTAGLGVNLAFSGNRDPTGAWDQ